MIRQIAFSSAVLAALVMSAASSAQEPPPVPPQTGKFQPTMESLKQYQCPEWFRDAKFGIWAHWGPQAVPMAGDWYARNMYMEGSPQYKHHLENYGHPSEHGYREIIDLWKAEKWDPERLMDLYQKAGAKYFVSMACHHDNFDLWNSKFHKWNAVNMGPKRDVVGEWQKAAQKRGMRFGVSEHMGASFTWWQPSHGADKQGPKAGVPYDGADPKYADLYHPPAAADDRGWYSNNPQWQREWYQRVTDLIDNYHPDLLYTDGGVPFGNDVGRSMIAHLYNTDLARHPDLQVVYTCKQRSEGRWVEDLERGVMPRINPDAWQTDTSIGDWYYNKNWKFRPITWVIYMLTDIVSKNGNLLLNVVQRPDGSLDPEVEQMLQQMAEWNAVTGEAIYGTRPWLVYGEGPTRARGGAFGEDFAYSSRDIRFTTKGPALYAIALGWPEDNQLIIKSLAQPPAEGEKINNITDISMLGSQAKLQWKPTADGLVVTLPAGEKPSPYTCALKITGTELKPVEQPQVVPVVKPDDKGIFKLNADAAELHGDQLKLEQQGGRPNIGYWDNPADWVSWKVSVPKAGTYQVSALAATVNDQSRFTVDVGGKQQTGDITQTGGWGAYRAVDLGRIEVAQGEQVVKFRPADAQAWKAINLASVTLTPAQ